MDGKLDSRNDLASGERLPARRKPLRVDTPLLFGIVTFLCLVAALTLSAYGHLPVLMLPIALACAVAFVRHGDGREHWTPASAEDRSRRESRSRGR